MGSNGLTSARHDVFYNTLAEKYPESYDPSVPADLVYSGSYALTDLVEDAPMNAGRLVLSPTRTYLPVASAILNEMRAKVHGMVHCSGGGQTKCMKYMPSNARVVKNGLPEAPAVFKLIQANSGSSNREMFEVFNMGIRLEIYCPETSAQSIINLAQSFGVGAHLIGRVEEGVKKALEIHCAGERIVY